MKIKTHDVVKGGSLMTDFGSKYGRYGMIVLGLLLVRIGMKVRKKGL
jgi:hypothetical protein